jgi:predicted HTH domain antitoxin
MMLKTVLELEPEWMRLLRPLTNQPLDSFIKELLVLELYRRHVISSGKSAELLGMERMEFIHHASRLGIPFLDMSEAEWAEELLQIQALV